MKLAVVAVSALLVACSSNSPNTSSTSSPPVTNKPAETGAVDEAAFKAMHELPMEAPTTKRRGERIDLAGGKAYLAIPEGKGPFPGIVVIHEWWGLNGNIELWADRLASIGWAAIAVDLYEGKVTTTRDDAMAAMKAVDQTKAHATIKAAIDFLGSDARIKANTRAVIGWCFGGGWSLQAAIANPNLDGAIIYYGQLETDPAKLSAIKASVLGIFGKADKGIPPETVGTFEAALKQANVKAEIYSYEADHAFANPSNPKYDEKSAANAWAHVTAFLDKLKSGA